VPMTFLRPNPFLFLIAIFSFYLASAGWRFARNRSGIARPVDWFCAGSMGFGALGMLGLGLWMLRAGAGNGVTMLVFGVFATALSIIDLRVLATGAATGKRRIAIHLTMMLGGTIATLTAFLVTNFKSDPIWILWLAPSALLVPVIGVWRRKVMAGSAPTAIPPNR